MKRVVGLTVALVVSVAGFAGGADAQAGISVEVNCAATPESVRIVNSTAAPVTVRSLTSLIDPRPGVEPFALEDTVRPNDVIVYAFGPNPGAHAGARFLSGQPIFSSTDPAEGVEVVTTVGTARVLCSRGSGSVGQDQVADAGPGIAPGQVPARLGQPGPAPAGAPGKTTGALPPAGEPGFMAPAAILGGALLALGLALRLGARSDTRR